MESNRLSLDHTECQAGIGGRSRSSNKLFDIWSDEIRLGLMAVVADDVAIAVDQELLEVPGHVATLQGGVLSQPQEERMGLLAHDLDFRHHWEFNAKFFDDISLDDIFRIRLLASELVAREGQDLEVLVVSVVFVHLN